MAGESAQSFETVDVVTVQDAERALQVLRRDENGVCGTGGLAMLFYEITYSGIPVLDGEGDLYARGPAPCDVVGKSPLHGEPCHDHDPIEARSAGLVGGYVYDCLPVRPYRCQWLEPAETPGHPGSQNHESRHDPMLGPKWPGTSALPAMLGYPGTFAPVTG